MAYVDKKYIPILDHFVGIFIRDDVFAFDIFEPWLMLTKNIVWSNRREKTLIRMTKRERMTKGAGRPLSAVVGKIITPLCHKHGLMTADLVLEWPQIVGQELAKVCQVMKISFPGFSRQQGCLHLQTSSTMAMALTYSQPLIIERVNQYYGYQAISHIRIFHKPVVSIIPKPTKLPVVDISPEWQALTSTVTDKDLQQALENLGRLL